MSKISRVRERTATPAELAEDRRRCLEAKAPTDGNLCSVLRLFAAWRRCSACGLRVLFVDEQVQTDGDFVCGHCQDRAKTRARFAVKHAAHMAALQQRRQKAPAPQGASVGLGFDLVGILRSMLLEDPELMARLDVALCGRAA